MKYRYDKYREEVDVGCKFANNCFECPFSDCIISMTDVSELEEDYSAKREVIVERAKYVKSLFDGGMSRTDIAKLMNCAVKTVKIDLIIAKTLGGGGDAKQD